MATTQPYTVIYTDSWMSGSHMQTLTKMAHITATSLDEAYEQFDGSAVFIFAGHIKPL